MKRREFLGLGATVLAATAVTSMARAQAAITSHTLGSFTLEQTATGLSVTRGGRVLWETAADGNFLILETATADIRAFGTPEGSYEITDTVSLSAGQPKIDSIALDGARIVVRGHAGGTPFAIAFEAVSDTHLRFEISSTSAAINRVTLRLASEPAEAVFGFGEQLTDFNQKGNLIPVLVQEHGVGRGRPIVTELIDTFSNGGGGNPYVTEAPAPHFITSRLRSLCLENTEYSLFDMRPADRIDIKVWAAAMTGRIIAGDSPLELIAAYSDYCGRMRALPDWIHEGVVVAVQGGTDRAREKLKTVNDAGIPLSAFWIQDWTGVRVTSAGKQLWWDWKLDESFYPGWADLVGALQAQGARMLTYINPFLSNAPGHDALFNEGQAKGYLVEQADGSPYLIKNTDFFAGLIDLTNPDTRSWIKDVIKTQMIATGASGWMADFGEAMPFDGRIHGAIDPAAWHNQFSQEWAKLNREAIEEAGRGDDIVFFSRSGFTKSPGYSTLFWLGDQIQSWDQYDGIKTAVVGMLSGGVSGFSLIHSDTGGYVTLSLSLAGHKVPIFARSDELLQRWMELAAFTPVFRLHEGLDPAISAQFDSSAANLAHLKRCGTIYKALAPYRKQLVADAAAHGHPVTRHPFLHFPDDASTHELRYQFMLGPDLMVAPVLDKGATSVEIYLPPSSGWTDLWTGQPATTGWQRVPAPLGKPALFLRSGGASSDAIRAAFAGAGLF